MAKLDLIAVFELESLKTLLFESPTRPWGRVEAGLEDRSLLFSRQLGKALLEEFQKDPHFLASQPVLLGSWARGELCPKSDLDLLFLGPEKEISAFMQKTQQRGIKIRARTPQNQTDLCEGVELWDQLSLLDGIGLTEASSLIIEKEKHKILNAKLQQKREWVRAIRSERESRHLRFESMQNLLEPNLKLGLGGLRDLQQARQIKQLFPNLHESDPHVDLLLDFYLRAFLWIRQLLHLEGQGDLLSNHLQPPFAEQLGFEDYHQFMSFVQRGLSRVSFYSDWLLERALSGSPRKEPQLKRPEQLSSLLLQNPSVQNQYRVRRKIDELWPTAHLDRLRSRRGKEIEKFFSAQVGFKNWEALFRSRLMDRLLPELKPLVGYVQHDQYHRYTADAHVLQVIKQVLTCRKNPKLLGRVGEIARLLKEKDWKILYWTALYHDIAKGRPEDHSELGAKWVRRDLKAFGKSKEIQEEVVWLVKNHLAFSQAAFRRDVQDLQAYEELKKLKLTEGRIQRLLVFTALDILGTNPASWNDWKANLLSSLGAKLLSGENERKMELQKILKNVSSEDLKRLDLIGREVGFVALKRDLRKTQQEKSESIQVFKSKSGLWIRFHRRQDRTGTLAQILGALFHAGASVQMATVMTLPRIGVYDWFALEKSTRIDVLEKRLNLFLKQELGPAPRVKWERVDLVQSNSERWSLLFRGLDQRGLLWNAAARLSEAGAEIESAQVQTWGEKAEDLFTIRALSEDATEWLARFQMRLNKDA